MNGLKIERVTLTDEAVDNIFQTAIDAGHTYGFGYWAELKDVERANGRISAITLRETDEPRRMRRLEKVDLEAGIAKALSEPLGIRNAGLDQEYPDGPCAEMILQYAMFGEQVYG
jgi:hypothetical protein